MYVIKLRKIHEKYIEHVVHAMCQQHKLTYGYDADVQETTEYCIGNAYCMMNDDKTVVGFFSLSRFDLAIQSLWLGLLNMIFNILFGRVFIYDVYIFPEFRKKGNGKHMISRAVQEVKNNFMFVNVVCLHSASDDVVSFYKKCGFFLSGVANNATYMLKTL
jgi:GNAT superfamily N-acetyltransferase